MHPNVYCFEPEKPTQTTSHQDVLSIGRARLVAEPYISAVADYHATAQMRGITYLLDGAVRKSVVTTVR